MVELLIFSAPFGVEEETGRSNFKILTRVNVLDKLLQESYELNLFFESILKEIVSAFYIQVPPVNMSPLTSASQHFPLNLSVERTDVISLLFSAASM